MKSFIAALRTLVLPFGAISGRRIILDGINGVIQVYDGAGNKRIELGGVGSDDRMRLFTADPDETIGADFGTTVTGSGSQRRLSNFIDSPQFSGRLFSTLLLQSESFDGVIKTRMQYVAAVHQFSSPGGGGPIIDAIGSGDYRVNGVSIIPPTGGIIAYGGSSPPNGWALCDGTAYSRTTLAALFAVIGTTYGAGDGSTTFNVPDLRQRFPLGKAAAGTGSTLGGTGGSIDHTHSTPTHSHSLDGATGYAKIFIAAAANYVRMLRRTVASWVTTTEASVNISVGAGGNTQTLGADLGGNTSVDGGGTSGSTNPPFQTVNYIIKI